MDDWGGGVGTGRANGLTYEVPVGGEGDFLLSAVVVPALRKEREGRGTRLRI